MRVQDDDHLPGELPWSVAFLADSGSEWPRVDAIPVV
jgi:hypothetical protein